MISIIAAIGKNNELGKDNKLIWQLPNDLLFFKKITLNHCVIMGKNTYLSIGRPLPNRENIVISKTMEENDNIIIIRSFEEIVAKYLNSEEEVFIIGGASLYKYFIDYANKLYLTEINDTKEADTYFPIFDKKKYTTYLLGENEDNNIKYKHVLYRRKKL